MAYERELAAALDAAARAGAFIRDEYERFVPIPDAPVTISTHVDRESQELILTALRAAFPDYGLCAEEATATLAAGGGAADRVWVVDPIDGTRGFARKNGEFSVMIGLLERGEPVVGVVLEPTLDRTTYATRGGGCWAAVKGAEPARVAVRPCDTLADCVLVQSRSKPGLPPSKYVRAVGPLRVIETYSAGVKLALVARGEADLYVNSYDKFHDWDICAGHILVTEAGGTVTALDGRPITYGGPNATQTAGLLASNGKLHAAAVAAMAK